MVEGIEQTIGNIATTSMDALSASVYPIIWTLLGIVLVIFVVYYLSFRHKIRVRLLTSQGSVPYDDKAREVLVDGVRFWKLMKRKDVIPVPPKEGLSILGRDILGKPKYYAEVYWSEEDGYVNILDNITKENLRENIYGLDEHGEVKPIAGDAFKPFTPQQRSLLVQQIRKAQDRKKKGLLDYITQLAVPLALVALFMMVLLFWEDIAKPGREMASLNVQMQEKNQQLLGELSEISAQNARVVQALGDETKARELQIQQTVNSEVVS